MSRAKKKSKGGKKVSLSMGFLAPYTTLAFSHCLLQVQFIALHFKKVKKKKKSKLVQKTLKRENTPYSKRLKA